MVEDLADLRPPSRRRWRRRPENWGKRARWLRRRGACTIQFPIFFEKCTFQYRIYGRSGRREITLRICRQHRGPQMLTRNSVIDEVGTLTRDREPVAAPIQLQVVRLRTAYRGRHLGVGTALDSDATLMKVVLTALPDGATEFSSKPPKGSCACFLLKISRHSIRGGRWKTQMHCSVARKACRCVRTSSVCGSAHRGSSAIAEPESYSRVSDQLPIEWLLRPPTSGSEAHLVADSATWRGHNARVDFGMRFALVQSVTASCQRWQCELRERFFLTLS